jgi:hypothetical protein
MDAVIANVCGVLSLGSSANYVRDSVAIDVFMVSCSTGKDGPESATLSNLAPWITTVGAGSPAPSTDFPTYAVLGETL